MSVLFGRDVVKPLFPSNQAVRPGRFSSRDGAARQPAARLREDCRTAAGVSVPSTESVHAVVDPDTGEVLHVRRDGRGDMSSVFDPSEGRARRYRLQGEARRLLRPGANPGGGRWRVCDCLRRVNSSADGVSILRSETGGACHYGGLSLCGSPWTCPVCQSVVGRVRAAEITTAMDAWAVSGGWCVMVTLTVPHTRRDSLEFLLSGGRPDDDWIERYVRRVEGRAGATRDQLRLVWLWRSPCPRDLWADRELWSLVRLLGLPVCDPVAIDRAVSLWAAAREPSDDQKLLRDLWRLPGPLAADERAMLDALIERLDWRRGLRGAIRRFRNSRAYKSFSGSSLGLEGVIRALEVTCGDRNGWHPHVHELWFVRSGVDLGLARVRILDAWQRACVAAGLGCPGDAGVTVSRALSAAEYLTKFAKDQGWGAGNELTATHVKTGSGGLRGLSPWGLLDASLAGSDWASARFVEFASSFFGVRQLLWTPGLRERFGIEDLSDDLIVQVEQDRGAPVARVDADDWRVVRALGQRAALLSVAESSGGEGVQAFVSALLRSWVSCADFGSRRALSSRLGSSRAGPSRLAI